MAVLDRKELEESPLSDLHAIASELGIEGFRLLRRDKLIAAILGDSGNGASETTEEERAKRRRSRGGRSRSTERKPAAAKEDADADADSEDGVPQIEDDE